MAASLLASSVAAGVFVSPAPAGAADLVPDHVVMVYETSFDPATVYARPGETIEFKLADGVSAHHTVTLEKGSCGGRPDRLCERTFDDPNNPPPVVFRFSDIEEYPFYDRYAREERGVEMTGKFVISDSPAPIPPSSTTTTVPPSTTTTTRPVTTTTMAPTTTTTAPSTIHPFLIPDAPSTTSTTAAPSPAPATNGAHAPAASKDKGKSTDKGKVKAASTETPTTASPAPPQIPTDVIFDPASLTPGPTMVPETPTGPDDGDEAALDAATVVSLLDQVDKSRDDNTLMLLAVGTLALLLLAGGIWGWHNRASRYDPA